MQAHEAVDMQAHEAVDIGELLQKLASLAEENLESKDDAWSTRENSEPWDPEGSVWLHRTSTETVPVGELVRRIKSVFNGLVTNQFGHVAEIQCRCSSASAFQFRGPGLVFVVRYLRVRPCDQNQGFFRELVESVRSSGRFSFLVMEFVQNLNLRKKCKEKYGFRVIEKTWAYDFGANPSLFLAW